VAKYFLVFRGICQNFPPKRVPWSYICNQKFHFSHLCEIWHTKKKRAGRESFSLFSRKKKKKKKKKENIYIYIFELASFFSIDRPRGTYMPQFVSFVYFVICIGVKFLKKKRKTSKIKSPITKHVLIIATIFNIFFIP